VVVVHKSEHSVLHCWVIVKPTRSFCLQNALLYGAHDSGSGWQACVVVVVVAVVVVPVAVVDVNVVTVVVGQSPKRSSSSPCDVVEMLDATHFDKGLLHPHSSSHCSTHLILLQ